MVRNLWEGHKNGLKWTDRRKSTHRTEQHRRDGDWPGGRAYRLTGRAASFVGFLCGEVTSTLEFRSTELRRANGSSEALVPSSSYTQEVQQGAKVWKAFDARSGHRD